MVKKNNRLAFKDFIRACFKDEMLLILALAAYFWAGFFLGAKIDAAGEFVRDLAARALASRLRDPQAVSRPLTVSGSH